MRLGGRKKAGSAVLSKLANEDCSLETGEEVKSRVVLGGRAVNEAASRSTPAQTHTSRRFMSTLLEFCSVESSSRSLRWQRKRRERWGGGRRPGVRHAGDQLSEPLKASGVYVCWSEAAEEGGRETQARRRERKRQVREG